MIIRPIEKLDVESGFRCGIPTLDSYFAKHALSHQKADVARVYVLQDDETPEGKPGAVVGFYTLAAKALARERLRGPLPSSLPKYPLPVFFLGYFAVSENYQRRGYGRNLMADALRRCAEGVKSVGAVGVFLDSLDERSSAFYRSLGFLDIPREPSSPAIGPQSMFLPMKDLLGAKPT